MKIFLVEKEEKKGKIFSLNELKKKLREVSINGRQRLHRPTSMSMQAFLVLVPRHHQVNGRQFIPVTKGIAGQRLWIRIEERTPNTPASLYF